MKNIHEFDRHVYGDNFLDMVKWLVYEHLFSKVHYNLGIKLRRLLLQHLLKSMGHNTTISSGVKLLYPQGIEIGDYVGVARDVVLDGRGGIRIGEYTIIGFESVILTCTHNHNRKDIPIREQGMYTAPCKIGKDCWIDARVIVFLVYLSGMVV